MEMMLHMHKGDIIRTADSTPSYKENKKNKTTTQRFLAISILKLEQRGELNQSFISVY